jgi:hypothetical protein
VDAPVDDQVTDYAEKNQQVYAGIIPYKGTRWRGKRPKAASVSAQEAIKSRRRWNSGFFRQKIASVNGMVKAIMSKNGMMRFDAAWIEWKWTMLKRAMVMAVEVIGP